MLIDTFKYFIKIYKSIFDNYFNRVTKRIFIYIVYNTDYK